jgi:hypothetical protein
VIEACRKADWMDASMGKLCKDMAKTAITEGEAAFRKSWIQ